MHINMAFLKLPLRAEGEDPSLLVKTFVDVAHLFTMLSNDDHQVLYGRRGTGKTHALKYLVEHTRTRGQVPVYVDMRTLGSSGGLYADDTAPLSERATRLLVDTLLAIRRWRRASRRRRRRASAAQCRSATRGSPVR